MPSRAAEDYLKALCVAQEQAPGQAVPMGAVARALGVAPGTATAMAKTLAAQNWAHYAPRVGLTLTPEGLSIALAVLRRHRLIETFLAQTLRLSWDEVHVEAERLEHALSDRVLEALDRFLEYPEHDPHGDPIPREGQALQGGQPASSPLSAEAEGRALTVARIVDQDAAFLGFIARRRMRPGAAVTVVARDEAAEAMTVQVQGAHAPVQLGLSAAEKILVHASAG